MHPCPQNLPPGFVPPQNPRFRRGRGQRYVPDVVERVRLLVEGTILSRAAVATRAGIGAATVAVWIRRHGWQRPLNAYRCTRFLAAERAGLGPRLAAGFARVAVLAEGERRRVAGSKEPDPSASKAASRLAGAARRAARHHDRANLGRTIEPATLPGRWEPVRLSLAFRPVGPRRRPRTDDVVAQARHLWEHTTLRRDVVARQVGVNAATLSIWAGAGGWLRPEGAPSRFGGPGRNPRWEVRMEARIEARHRLGEAERLLDALDRDERVELARIEEAFRSLQHVLSSLQRQPLV